MKSLIPLGPVCERNVIVARFHVLVKLEKVEEEEAKALLENLPEDMPPCLR
jgi:hypothetical protein